jgi:hypothetical protein
MGDALDEDLAALGPDPEWDELLAWAREPEAPLAVEADPAGDEEEWGRLLGLAKARPESPRPVATAPSVKPEEPVDDAEEWGRLLELAKAIPSQPRAVRPRPAPPREPATIPAPAGSIASLTARLERLATQVPDARRRAR